MTIVAPAEAGAAGFVAPVGPVNTAARASAGVTGKLAGIARHACKRGPMEELETVCITVESGLDGDFRGVVKPGGTGRRQVSLIEAGDWAAAMADLGAQIRW